MPIKTKAELKAIFSDGNPVGEEDYEDLIDTMGDMYIGTYDTDSDGQVEAADAADSVPWTGVTGKPSTFPPESHTHPGGDITSAVAEAVNADTLDTLHASSFHREDQDLIAEGYDIRTSQGISVGDTSIDPGVGIVGYTGNLRAVRGGSSYIGYIYVPLQEELTSVSWDGDSFSTVGKTVIDLSSVFGVPPGVKGVDVSVSVRDSDSANGDYYMFLSPRNTSGTGKVAKASEISDRRAEYSFIVPCDDNGDIYYQIVASGSNTFDVWLKIWGYFI